MGKVGGGWRLDVWRLNCFLNSAVGGGGGGGGGVGHPTAAGGGAGGNGKTGDTGLFGMKPGVKVLGAGGGGKLAANVC